MKLHWTLIRIAYLGKSYHGSQIQPNVETVGRVLTQKLAECGASSPQFASRTDKGVNAIANVILTSSEMTSELLAGKLTEKLSAIIGASYMVDDKTVSYSQINTDVFSNIDFVGAGTLGLIAAGFPAAQAAALATDPNFNPLFFILISLSTTSLICSKNHGSTLDKVNILFKSILFLIASAISKSLFGIFSLS